MISLLVVDDHPPVRRAVRAWLAAQPDIEIVGEAIDGEESVALACELQPDVVLMDIEMPGMDGTAATDEILRGTMATVIIAYSVHDDPVIQARARRAGAVAFVPKHRTQDVLLATIRAVAGKHTL
jgi:DNA-binding NarL/FixJ family response regulator